MNDSDFKEIPIVEFKRNYRLINKQKEIYQDKDNRLFKWQGFADNQGDFIKVQILNGDLNYGNY